MKIAVLKYDKDACDKRVCDILEDLYFAASNWMGYSKSTLSIIVQHQWTKQIEVQTHKEIMYLFTNQAYIGFRDPTILAGPMINQLNMRYLGHEFAIMTYTGAHSSGMFTDYLGELGNQHIKKDEMLLVIDDISKWNSIESSVIDIFTKLGVSVWSDRYFTINTLL